MASYYIAIFDKQYTESGESGWIVNGPFLNAKTMVENIKYTLPKAVMAEKMLFLRTVNLVEEDS